jgi:pilus assembly protein CpaB
MGRRITAISLALLLALLGASLVVVHVGRADARALEDVEAVTVLVAKAQVSKGMTAGFAQAEGLIGTEQLPRKVVPAESLTQLAPSDAGLVFATDVTAGEIIQRPRLVQATEAESDQGLKIPEGKLAVTVQLEDPARVGGLVQPGSEIAIFDTFTVHPGRAPGAQPTGTVGSLESGVDVNHATRVLLPRVTVLGIGTTTSAAPPAPTDGEPPVSPQSDPAMSPLVTVAVDQNEAERLIHATRTGSLYLGLLDTYQVQPGPGVDTDSLFNR